MDKKEFLKIAVLDGEADHCGYTGWAYGHWDAEKTWTDSGLLNGEKITAIFVLDDSELNFEDGTDVNWDDDLVAYQVADTGQIIFIDDISSAAAALGKIGGQSKSEAKKKASRENGKKGGRPRKNK